MQILTVMVVMVANFSLEPAVKPSPDWLFASVYQSHLRVAFFMPMKTQAQSAQYKS